MKGFCISYPPKSYNIIIPSHQIRQIIVCVGKCIEYDDQCAIIVKLYLINNDVINGEYTGGSPENFWHDLNSQEINYINLEERADAQIENHYEKIFESRGLHLSRIKSISDR